MATFLSVKPLAVLLGFLLCSLVSAAESSNENSLMLLQFDTEKSERFNIFKANYEYIHSKNREHGLTSTLGLKQFCDLTNEEFVARYTSGLPPIDAPVTVPASEFEFDNLSAPASIDWRIYGAVTPVKDQGPFS